MRGQVHRFVIALRKTKNARSRVVFFCYRRKADLRSCVLRPAMLRRAYRAIIWSAVIIGTVVVIEGRDREQQPWLKRVRPGESPNRVTLPLHVADSSRLPRRIVRNLIIVTPEQCHHAEL